MDKTPQSKGLAHIPRNCHILSESLTRLAEVKSWGLTHTLIHEALQTGKYWEELKGIL